VGYNTVNVYAYYGLNSIFKTEIDGEKINMKAFNIGVIFYIIIATSNNICGMLPKRPYN
jgi:hypothetical protein